MKTVCVAAILMALSAGMAPAQQPGKTRSAWRSVTYLAAGAGLFVGGVFVMENASRYERQPPTCIYFLGCISGTQRVTNQTQQSVGYAMMAGGAVLGFWGYYRLTSPYARAYDVPGPDRIDRGMSPADPRSYVRSIPIRELYKEGVGMVAD